MTTFYNKASLLYNGTVTTSNTVSGTISDAIEITKTPLISSYAGGDNMTYIINLTAGKTAVTSLTVTDDLGAYDLDGSTLTPLTYINGSLRYYVNGALGEAPTVSATTPLTISGINVPANGNAMLIYGVTVNEFAPRASGESITNTATASGASCSGTSASALISVSDAPKLSIIKSLEPTTVEENGNVTYTIQITNSGNTALVATDNATISDVFSPPLDQISVTFNGEAWTSPTNYSYSSTTGEFSTANGQIIVPAATFTRGSTGEISTTPGTSVLTISGTIRCPG